MNLINTNIRLFFVSSFIVVVLLSTIQGVEAQQSNDALNQRITQLENYVATIQPTIIELSENLNTTMQEYAKGLETSLENYSQNLQINLDERVKSINQNAVILNPFSKSYQSINTNTGTFLISVERVEPIDGGVRLHINIGNPNYADYQNFTLKFIWGNQWGGKQVMPYSQWRQSLNGVEYTFQGKIEKGKWNAMEVDLIPTGDGDLSFLECEMTVSSVELRSN